MNLGPVIRNQIFFVLTGNSEAHTEYQVFKDGSRITVGSYYLTVTWVEQWLYSFEDVLVAQSTFSGLTRVFCHLNWVGSSIGFKKKDEMV